MNAVFFWQIHMITSSGIHKEVIIGNPLEEKEAKLIALVPKGTYFIPESLSEEKANFHSYISVPGRFAIFIVLIKL